MKGGGILPTINNIYIWVKDEDIGRSTQVPQHPVEKGLPITDNIRNEPKTLSLSGKIVNTSQYDAPEVISKIEALRTSGSLINYKGRNVAGNFLIKTFDTSHPNTVWGGADFSMELVEVRIAKSSYNPKSQKTTSTSTANVNLAVGAIVVFKGGSVYVSSDAKTAAATRGRSTCKITKTSFKSWSIHQYHLISTDGKMVYGWVDKANIEGAGGAATTSTAAVTTAGTQQVQTQKTTATTVVEHRGSTYKSTKTEEQQSSARKAYEQRVKEQQEKQAKKQAREREIYSKKMQYT